MSLAKLGFFAVLATIVAHAPQVANNLDVANRVEAFLPQEPDRSSHSSSRPIQRTPTSGYWKDTGGQPKPRRSEFR